MILNVCVYIYIFFHVECGFVLLFQIYVPTNPRGAESLPPGILVSESDFYLRRLWGEPSEV